VSGQYENTAVQDCDPSSVNPAYLVYIPGSWRPYAYNLTVGYEDLALNHPGLDYDYNDFNTAIQTQFITDPENQNLQRIIFNITPRARGGQYTHALHMLFPANVFSSDGTATLTLKDPSGRPLSSVQQPFIASQANDYTVLPCTCDAFPGEKGIVNALEGTPYQNTQRIAELSITFNTPFQLNLDIVDENRIEIAHGAGLFFDPYLHVFNTNDDIHQGDPRIISAPSDFWRWPEEGVRIDRAYSMVTGTPPDQSFPSEWWINHNNCIYGDGVVCPE
jgi:LruC domain-containing protein